jgi:DNA-binding MarR family transcriptional regulator
MREHHIDLTFDMLLVLRSLNYSGPVNQQELANRTYKDKSSLSYLIDNLEKRDLVKREGDCNDKRSKVIIMTDKGNALYAEIKKIIEDVYDEMSQKEDLSHVQLCIDYLKEFKQKLIEK